MRGAVRPHEVLGIVTVVRAEYPFPASSSLQVVTGSQVRVPSVVHLVTGRRRQAGPGVLRGAWGVRAGSRGRADVGRARDFIRTRPSPVLAPSGRPWVRDPAPLFLSAFSSSTFSPGLSLPVCKLGTGMAPASQTRGRRAQSGAPVAAVRVVAMATASGCRENGGFGLWTSPPAPSRSVPLCLRLGFDCERCGHRRSGARGGRGAVVRPSPCMSHAGRLASYPGKGEVCPTGETEAGSTSALSG